jgi:hypothetical protein
MHNKRIKALADLKEKAAENNLHISKETARIFLNDPENEKIFGTNPNGDDPYTKVPMAEADKLIEERKQEREKLY